jgi:hypothetical protein
MGSWDLYHTRGELGPKVDCLDKDGQTVLLSYTWTDVAAGSLFELEHVAPVMSEFFELEEKIRLGIDGHKIVETGGYYYRARLEFPLLSKAVGGEVCAVLNHCARGGMFKVKFYPHSDNDDIFFVCHVKGCVDDFKVDGRPFAGGHAAALEVIGLAPFKSIPWPVDRGLKFMDKSLWGSYSGAEKVNCAMADGSSWGSFSTSEKESTLGYLTDTSEELIFD